MSAAETPLSGLLSRAFREGPGMEANPLIDAVRREIREAHGTAFNYEVALGGRGWDHIRQVVAPRLALYMHAKKQSPRGSAAVFVSLFVGDRLHFILARDLLEYVRVQEGLSEEVFDQLLAAWQRSGRRSAGALPP